MDTVLEVLVDATGARTALPTDQRVTERAEVHSPFDERIHHVVNVGTGVSRQLQSSHCVRSVRVTS